MEMEFEGYIQQQSTYSHVGYTAAAVNHSVLDQNHMGIGLSLCITLVLTVVAMSVHRQTRTGWSRAAVVTLAILAGLFAAQSVYALFVPRFEIDPRFAQTLYNIEAMTAKTEAWAAENGRVPTVEEWGAQFAIPEARDGWGRPFEYEVLDEPGPFDGQLYTIRVCKQAQRIEMLYQTESSLAGPDGLFNTEDDFYMLGLSVLEYRKVDLSNLRHGRSARDPLPELPKPKSR